MKIFLEYQQDGNVYVMDFIQFVSQSLEKSPSGNH